MGNALALLLLEAEADGIAVAVVDVLQSERDALRTLLLLRTQEELPDRVVVFEILSGQSLAQVALIAEARRVDDAERQLADSDRFQQIHCICRS